MARKFYNPDYSNPRYSAEWATYCQSKSPIKNLSLDFCIRFLELLPKWDVGSDREEYRAWGEALPKMHRSDEEDGHEAWKWVRFWERSLYIDELQLIMPLKELADWLDVPPNH